MCSPAAVSLDLAGPSLSCRSPAEVITNAASPRSHGSYVLARRRQRPASPPAVVGVKAAALPASPTLNMVRAPIKPSGVEDAHEIGGGGRCSGLRNRCSETLQG